MKIEVRSTGSITDKAFSLLEGATGFIKLADKLERAVRIAPNKLQTITITKQDAAATAKMLRQATLMIENLLSVIEMRELPKLDRFGNRVSALPAPKADEKSK